MWYRTFIFVFLCIYEHDEIFLRMENTAAVLSLVMLVVLSHVRCIVKEEHIVIDMLRNNSDQIHIYIYIYLYVWNDI